ncbi:MAG: carbohydrate kinase [Planctomycetaceae bacterium]|nr:carbohydrate kinase [Planctomycetaceae bacterium]
MIDTVGPLVIGLGEVLWDLFPDAQKPGGAPANVAFQAGQLGGRGAVASRVGRGELDRYVDERGNVFDRLGDRLVSYLGERGLDLSALQRDDRHSTGCVTVDVSDPHHPRYTIHEGAWDFIAADRALVELAGRADAICFGSLAQRSPDSRAAIHAALAAAGQECLTVFDVNLRQNWWDIEWITRSMQAADVLKLNHDEVATLAPLMNAPAEPLRFARHAQQAHGIETVCITRAEHGCLLVRGDETVDLPGIKVNVVDAVGAGDAFSAALIIATLRNWPLQNTGELANRVGALVASRPGAMPDLREELAGLLTELSPA